MCLQLTYAEALQWKNNASDIVTEAKAMAAKHPPDPLLTSNKDLSALVTEIDSIKKRHGLLIEEALIFAINKVPGWSAKKEKIKIAGGKAHLDCLAYNNTTKKLYVFECKRGHGKFDADAINAINDRLDKIKAAILSHVKPKGWSPCITDIFILSFYGNCWNSNYQIYTSNDVGTLFEPCIGTFVDHFMRHVENQVHVDYAMTLRGSQPSDNPNQTIFDQIQGAPKIPNQAVQFDKDGACVVPSQSS